MIRIHAIRALTLVGLLMAAPALLAQKPAPTPKPSLPVGDAGEVHAGHELLRLRPPRGDDPDAGRREALHGHPRPEGREGRADAPDPHAVRRGRDDEPRPRARTSGPMLDGYDNATDVIVEGGYIRVVQDVRGKYGSEGDYVMNRPLRGPLNPTAVDHATDTYDTIDWLVKNVPESNGKVGHPRHLLRRLHAADGALQSASGAEGLGPHESDGGRLDGRRLVPLRRLPAARRLVHLRAGGRTARTRSSGGRATSTTTTRSCRPARRASSAASTAWSSSASGRS